MPTRGDVEGRLARYRARSVRGPKVTVMNAGPMVSSSVAYDVDGGPSTLTDFVANAPKDIEFLLDELDRVTADANGLLDELTRPAGAPS